MSKVILCSIALIVDTFGFKDGLCPIWRSDVLYLGYFATFNIFYI